MFAGHIATRVHFDAVHLLLRPPNCPINWRGKKSDNADWQTWNGHIPKGIMSVALVEAGFKVCSRMVFSTRTPLKNVSRFFILMFSGFLVGREAPSYLVDMSG